jgi:hypothetical protein
MSICDRLGEAFANTAQSSHAEYGNYYPFGGAQRPRNPNWFYFQTVTPGQVELELHQNESPLFDGAQLDVDFAVYGPFNSLPTTECGQLTPQDVIASSFSVDMPEKVMINNVQAGEYYLVLASNFLIERATSSLKSPTLVQHLLIVTPYL